MYELTQTPRAVVIPREVEEAWSVLALAALSRHTPDLGTVRLRENLWVRFICVDGHVKPRGVLEAARVLDVLPEVHHAR